MKMRVSSSRAFVCVSVLTGMFLAGFLLLYSRTTTFARNFSATNVKRAEETTKKAPDLEKKATILAAYGKLPLAFERNKGQADPQVQYLTRGSGYELFLTPKEAVLGLWQSRKSEGRAHHSATTDSATSASSTLAAPSEARATRKASVLRLQLAGANPSPAISGIDKLQRKANYFTGNNRANWVTDVPSYARVEYRSVYPGIDLDFYGNQRRLEYDFAVAPGADPKAISFKLQGSKSTHIDSRGNLVVIIPSGSVSFKKPLIYQMDGGQRREVAGGYLLAKNDEVGFTVSGYDRARPLIIDPVLDYSTYLASSVLGDQAFGVAVDGNGNAFVTGQTFNATFPLSTSPATGVGLGTPDAGIASDGGAFVSEINPGGTAELYFSYLSGDGGEVGYGIAVDPVANSACQNGLVNSFCVYVTGQTFSDNFPVGSVVTPYNAMAPTGGAPTGGNAFVTKLNPYATGASSLLYSSYLASTSAGDIGQAIAVDSAQDAYITGNVLSSPGAVPAFPILNGAQTTLPNASGNAYLTVMNTTTGALVYSTYLGGNDMNAGTSELGLGDIGLSVAVDSSQIAYIAGATPSTDFPNLGSTGTFPNIKGWAGPNGSNAVNEGFLAAINTTLTGVNSLVYSTYIGGSTADRATSLASAGSGVVYVTGRTKSTDFTTTQTGTAGQFPSLASVNGVVFITKLNTAAGGAPSYSVLLGGTSGDIGNGIQLDTLGNVIVAGTTQSPDFPVTPGAFEPTRGTASGDAFIAKINPAATGSAGLLYSTYFGGSGTPPMIDQGNGIALDTTNNVFIAGQTYSQADFPISSGAFQTTFGSVSDTSAGFVSKLTLLPVLAFGTPCAFNLTVTPATSCALAFGNQTFNTASTAMTFAITNNTGSSITLTTPTTFGTNSTDFVPAPAVSGSAAACTGTLAAGASCGIGVTFTPSNTGAEVAALSVPYTYSTGINTPSVSATQTVALTGTGTSPTVVLNPTTTLNFATPQPVNTTSTALPVTVTNTGLGNLIFTSAPSTGSTEFVISSTTCSTSSPLAQNGSCTINITFKPSTTGARSATLTIADNATSSPQTLSLAGTGVLSAPIATITPTSPVAFGGQLVTTTSTAQVVTVKNTGNATLTISSTPSISGTNASDFAISSNTCTSGASVAANATCTINVTFTPPAGASGSLTATLNVADNASGSPQAVSLTGTAQDFSISAQPITVSPGSSGTIPVTVTGIGGFTGQVTLACSGTIPQGSCAGPASAVTAPGTGNVTVTTHSFVAPPSAMKLPPISRQQLLLVILALMLLFTLPITRRARTRLGLTGVAALLIFAAGCSNTPPTPANTYSVTITGTSGGVSHSITVNVTVS